MSRRIAALAALAVLLIACSRPEVTKGTADGAPAPASQSSNSPVRIGYQKLSIYAPVFIAQDKGFFQKHGVHARLSPFTSANQMMNALLAGQLDATGLSNVQVALSVEAKDPGKTRFINFLVWSRTSFADYFLVKKGSGVTTIKGVEGKTVGVHPGSAVKAFATALLNTENVDLGETTLVELEPATMAAAFVAGRVDALYCMDPVATKLISAGEADVLVQNPIGAVVSPPVPISGTLLSVAFTTQRTREARALESALEDAIDFIRVPTNHAEMARIVAKYTNATPEDILRERVPQYWKRPEIDRAHVRALSERFHALGIVPAGVSADRMIIE